MDFSEALRHLKEDKRIYRMGWNGKEMYIFLLDGGLIPKEALYDGKLKKIANDLPGDRLECLPTIRMKTADNKILTGWLASQSDLFAEDWKIYGD